MRALAAEVASFVGAPLRCSRNALRSAPLLAPPRWRPSSLTRRRTPSLDRSESLAFSRASASKVVAEAGNVSATQMQSAFQLLRPTATLSKWVSVMEKGFDPKFREGYLNRRINVTLLYGDRLDRKA